MALPMTKSTLSLAKEALATAKRTLPKYSAVRSRKDFTQHQLFSILVVRQWSELRKVLRLRRVPHYTTLQKAHARILKKGLSRAS